MSKFYRMSKIFVLWMIVVLVTGTSQGAWASSSAPAAAPTGSPALAGAVQGTLVSGPQSDPSLDAPPPAAQAVVSDPRNPDWKAYYGSQAGLQLYQPRLAPSRLALISAR